jgi:glycosyltransferase involved in cell wall biosynthesis
VNLRLHNVNLSSHNGPNSFAQKLVKYGEKSGWCFDTTAQPSAHLCFIETHAKSFDEPMYQRLDGIYFNTRSDYNLQNANIKRTYEMSDGVIFQSEFNKRLITKYFGEHKSSVVIHNGADLEKIHNIKPLENSVIDGYEDVWTCASHWRPHKRLSENIRYFLEHSSERDCMVVAGKTDYKKAHPRVFFVGDLPHEALIALYKRSKHFLHLAWLDHCPNVVVDARASGCRIVCTDAGGTNEIAGDDAIVLQEEEWDFEPLDLYEPSEIDFNKIVANTSNTGYNIDMNSVFEKYSRFIESKS